MQPKITLFTISVDDLHASYRFYHEGLGFPSTGIQGEGDGAIAFFDLQNGLKFGIWNREHLAKDGGIGVDAKSLSSFAIAHNVSSKEEVDRVLAFVEQVGGKITSPAKEVFWGGYSGYFQDPDGYLWEVAYNPYWENE